MSDSRPFSAIDPRAGQRDALHQQRRAVAVGPDVRAEALEILQPVELPGMEMPRRRRRAHDHLDDRRRQPDDSLDAREQLIVERRDHARATRFALRLRRPDRARRSHPRTARTTCG